MKSGPSGCRRPNGDWENRKMEHGIGKPREFHGRSGSDKFFDFMVTWGYRKPNGDIHKYI